MHANGAQTGHLFHDLLAAGDRRNSLQLRLKRSIAVLICHGLVHARSVEVSREPGPGSMRRSCGGLLQQLVQHFAVVLGELVITRPKYLIGGNWILLEPRAAGILVKVLAGIHAPVHGAQVKELRTLNDVCSSILALRLGWREKKD